MNNWNEKTTLEKVATIISGIALCIWLVFEYHVSKNAVPYAEIVTYVSFVVICICEAISFWRVKRAFSYIAIGGAVLLTAVLILLAL